MRVWCGNVDCIHQTEGRTYWQNYILTYEFIPLAEFPLFLSAYELAECTRLGVKLR